MAMSKVQEKANMSNEQIVTALRTEASKNEVFNAICHIFALRHRSRQQITVGSLRLKMAQEGYNFSKEQCWHVLRFLSSLGIGYLEFDSTTKELVALKNIRLTLQSIGLVAVGTSDKLIRFNPLIEFLQLPANNKPMPSPIKSQSKAKDDFEAAVTVNVDGKVMTFELPKGISARDLVRLIGEVYATPMKGK